MFVRRSDGTSTRHGLFCAWLAFLLAMVVLPGFASAGPTDASSRCPINVVPREAGWTSIMGPPATIPALGDSWGHGMETFVVLPNDPNTIFAATHDELFRSRDGGCNWTRIFPGPNVDTPLVDCGPIGNGGTADIPTPPCARIYDLDLAQTDKGSRIYMQLRTLDNEHAFGISLIFVSDDMGDTWKRLDGGGAPMLTTGRGPLTVAPSDPSIIYVKRWWYRTTHEISHAVLVSRDGGSSWDIKALPGEAPTVSMRQLPPMVVSPHDPNEIWSLGTRMTATAEGARAMDVLFHSKDGGASWTTSEFPFAAQALRGHINDLAVNPAGDSVEIAATDGESVWSSADGGENWTFLFSGVAFGEYLFKLEYGKTTKTLFIIAENNVVVRFDVKRGIGTVIKSRSFASNAQTDESGWHSVDYVPGAGLYVLGECGDAAGCAQILRYIGRGT